MFTFEHELRYLRAGASELETYLLSPELYWPIGIRSERGEKTYPRLTLGNLLLSKEIATALAKTPEQVAALREVTELLDANYRHWRTAWGKKATAEFRSRLNLWQAFLDDFREQPESNRDRYAYEVGRRVILNLLMPIADEVNDAEIELLGILDRTLRANFLSGDFIWDKAVASQFPIDPYWFLYGNLRS